MSEVGDVKGGIEALLFDLGGVIFEIDFGGALAAWSAHSGEREEVIGERFSFDISYERHERGEIDASQYFQSLRSLLRIDLTDAQFAEGWNSIYGPELEIVERASRSAGGEDAGVRFHQLQPDPSGGLGAEVLPGS